MEGVVRGVQYLNGGVSSLWMEGVGGCPICEWRGWGGVSSIWIEGWGVSSLCEWRGWGWGCPVHVNGGVVVRGVQFMWIEGMGLRAWGVQFMWIEGVRKGMELVAGFISQCAVCDCFVSISEGDGITSWMQFSGLLCCVCILKQVFYWRMYAQGRFNGGEVN